MEAEAIGGLTKRSSILFFDKRHNSNFQCEGLIKIILWEEEFEDVKLSWIDQNSIIINVYYIYYNAINNFWSEEVSQEKCLR